MAARVSLHGLVDDALYVREPDSADVLLLVLRVAVLRVCLKAAVWAECTLVGDLVPPIVEHDFEVLAALGRWAAPVYTALLVEGDVDRHAHALPKMPQRPKRLVKHGATPTRPTARGG